MASIEESIEAAVFTRAAGLLTLAALPVSWPNVAFSPPSNGRYLRVSLLPNVTQRLFINSATHRRPGILQISVVVPLNVGASAATRIAGQVAEHFPMDLRVTSGGVSVRVTKAPDIAPAIKEDAAWIVPVSVSFQAFA